MSEWFPMSTARIVRDGRHVELRIADSELALGANQLFAEMDWQKEHLRRDADGTGYVVGSWNPDERMWVLGTVEDIDAGHGWSLIDDDFTGWRNLTPVRPE